MITVVAFTHECIGETPSMCFEENDIQITSIEDSYIDMSGFQLLIKRLLEYEMFDINSLEPNEWYSMKFINHPFEEDTDGSYYQWFEFVSAVKLK